MYAGLRKYAVSGIISAKNELWLFCWFDKMATLIKKMRWSLEEMDQIKKEEWSTEWKYLSRNPIELPDHATPPGPLFWWRSGPYYGYGFNPGLPLGSPGPRPSVTAATTLPDEVDYR